MDVRGLGHCANYSWIKNKCSNNWVWCLIYCALSLKIIHNKKRDSISLWTSISHSGISLSRLSAALTEILFLKKQMWPHGSYRPIDTCIISYANTFAVVIVNRNINWSNLLWLKYPLWRNFFLIQMIAMYHCCL